MASNTIENYLKAIYSLQQKQEKVNITDVSKHLEVSAATVNNMMQKLKKMKWVKQEKYQPVTLTVEGEKRAAMIIRKHRIAEMYLTEKMGLGWENVHSIAEEMEHIDSSILFDRMDELLDYPKYDPHGSPIPNKDGKIVKMNFHLLSQAETGSLVQLVGVEDSSKELLEFFNQKMIRLGTEMKVLEIASFDKSLLLEMEEKDTLVLSSKVCNALRVIEVEK